MSVFIRKNILNFSLSWSKSSETNPWHRLLCFSASRGFTHTAWKVSKYGVFYGPYFLVFRLNTGKYGPEKIPYLDTFHTVPTFPLSCVWNNAMFPIMFHKLRTCSNNAKSANFFSEVSPCYFPYSYLTLFACTLLRISFEALFLNL